jgi:hypothetical protein
MFAQVPVKTTLAVKTACCVSILIHKLILRIRTRPDCNETSIHSRDMNRRHQMKDIIDIHNHTSYQIQMCRTFPIQPDLHSTCSNLHSSSLQSSRNTLPQAPLSFTLPNPNSPPSLFLFPPCPVTHVKTLLSSTASPAQKSRSSPKHALKQSRRLTVRPVYSKATLWHRLCTIVLSNIATNRLYQRPLLQLPRRLCSAFVRRSDCNGRQCRERRVSCWNVCGASRDRQCCDSACRPHTITYYHMERCC